MPRIGVYESAGQVGHPDLPLPVTNAAAVPAAAVGTSVTAGAIGAVVADTGDIPAGDYFVEVSLGFSGVLAAGKHIEVQHRNAADAATLRVLGLCPAGQSHYFELKRITILEGESIRAVIGAVAAAAAEVAHASIRVYKIQT